MTAWGNQPAGEAIDDIFSPILEEFAMDSLMNHPLTIEQLMEVEDGLCLVEDATGEPCSWGVCSAGQNSGRAGEILEVLARLSIY